MLDVFNILLVEDHPADVALTRKAFARLLTPNVLHVTFDGREAMTFLRQTGRYENAPRPDLVLLDLNMPRMGGYEVLKEVDDDPLLRGIPVVILTTSSSPTDVEKAYSLCANSYVSKPVKFADFLTLIEGVETYWLKTALVPRRKV